MVDVEDREDRDECTERRSSLRSVPAASAQTWEAEATDRPPQRVEIVVPVVAGAGGALGTAPVVGGLDVSGYCVVIEPTDSRWSIS